MARTPLSIGFSTLAVVALLAAGLRVVGTASDRTPPETDPECLATGECLEDRPWTGEFAGSERAAAGTLLGAEVCRSAGYLCTGYAARGDARVARWADGTREIRIRVLPPDFESGSRRGELQRMAVAGILAWQGQPFPIRILRSEIGEADFEIRWVRSLNGNELGRTGTRWSSGPEGIAMEVISIELATRSPGSGAPRDPAAIRLTAAHEMGHALGLPHSDDRRDVMYPTNSALNLTAHDYSTMNALYRLQNGATIEIPGPD